MNAQEYPEVRLARRVIEKYKLVPPIDVLSLLEQYAEVVFEDIPIEGVDGIALNIKVPGKKPEIIINKWSIDTRQNFTMAHELGHLLIPWHTGIRVDESAESLQAYTGIEAEANRFAAALLMPVDYIKQVVAESHNLADAHFLLCQKLAVSTIPAAIQMASTLPKGVLYCITRNGFVEHGGRSKETSGILPVVGTSLQFDYFPFPATYSHRSVGNVVVHWWQRINKKLSKSVSQLATDTADKRTWRTILDTIVNDINPPQGVDAYKASITAVIAHANSLLARGENYSVDSLVEDCLDRLNNASYHELAGHKDFETFLVKRATTLVAKKKKSGDKS